MCFQDTYECHKWLGWSVYLLARIVSMLSIWNCLTEYDKSISSPTTPFKHSLFQLPFSFLKDISGRFFLVASLFLYLKTPRSVHFETSISYSLYHELFLWAPSAGPWPEGLWISKNFFQLLSYCPLLDFFFLCCVRAQADVIGVVVPGADISGRSGSFVVFCAAYYCSFPKALSMHERKCSLWPEAHGHIFSEAPWMDLPTIQFLYIKDVLQFEPTSNPAFGGASHSLLLPGAPGPTGSHQGHGDDSSPSIILCVCLTHGKLKYLGFTQNECSLVSVLLSLSSDYPAPWFQRRNSQICYIGKQPMIEWEPPSISNNDSLEPSLSFDLKFRDVLWWFSNAFTDFYLYKMREVLRKLKLCWASQLSLSSMEFVNRMWKHLAPVIFIPVSLLKSAVKPP